MRGGAEPYPKTGAGTGGRKHPDAPAHSGGGAGGAAEPVVFQGLPLKQQRAAETEEDYGDELETYDDTRRGTRMTRTKRRATNEIHQLVPMKR